MIRNLKFNQKHSESFVALLFQARLISREEIVPRRNYPFLLLLKKLMCDRQLPKCIVQLEDSVNDRRKNFLHFEYS